MKGKVIGKWESGVIFKTPMLSLKLEGVAEEDKYYDYPTTKAFWFACEIGSSISFPVAQNQENKKWYPV